MEVFEPFPIPNLYNDNINPQLGLQSLPSKSDFDPSSSDLHPTAGLVEECQNLENLDLGESEEKSSNLGEEEEQSDSFDDNKNKSGVENENGYQMIKKYPYPVRPDAEDCVYYIKYGSCKFGSNCKFNHPARRKSQGAQEKVKEREELVEKPGGPGQSQTACKYYLKTGGCKFGKACRYSHTRAKSPVVPIFELNFLGLPIRPGEKECPYYMRNGSCKYGSNCRYNHPDPTAVGGSDSPSGYGNGGSISSQASLGSWSSPRALNETAPFVQMIFPPSQAAASKNTEWNGYQGPLYSPERSINPMPAYAMKPLVIENNVYTHQPQQQQQQMLVDEFPERPGQPDCSYFLKTGDCKFKSNCKYHHPKNCISRSLPCALNDKGLPLRPDKNICSHYSRNGICKFGPACKFDHPVQPVASLTDSGLNSLTHFGNSATLEESGMAGNGNDR